MRNPIAAALFAGLLTVGPALPQDAPALPRPADVAQVTVEVAASPDLAQPAPTAGAVMELLRSYSVLDRESWLHGFSHVGNMDRTGRLVLRDGTEVVWAMRPGGLAWLTFPDGRELHLAFATPPLRAKGRVPPHDGAALPDLRIRYDGLDDLVRDAGAEDPDTQFAAVHRLALLADNEPGRNTLIRVAVDRHASETTREYAAMGLQNYAHTMPDEAARSVRGALGKVLEAEGGDAPAGVVRTLLALGAAAAVRETLGDALAGHPVEIEVLGEIGDAASVHRLVALRKEILDVRDPERFARVDRIARALVKAGDVRGVRYEIDLLRVRHRLPPVHGTNVFLFLTTVLRGDFASWRGHDPRTVPPDAIDGMIAWWDEHGADFRLPHGDRDR